MDMVPMNLILALFVKQGFMVKILMKVPKSCHVRYVMTIHFPILMEHMNVKNATNTLVLIINNALILVEMNTIH